MKRFKLYIALCMQCVIVAKGGLQVMADTESMDYAYVAGGCFWCLEPPYESQEGVYEVVSGFSGGEIPDPRYEDVARGNTRYLEVVRIGFDASKISYAQILDIFWRQIDPTDDSGQFVDRGHQYSTAIFYTSEEQKKIAEDSKRNLEESGWFSRPIVTVIRPFTTFYPADDYHQDYYKKSAFRYKYYRSRSGRDQFRIAVWGDEADQTDPIEKKQ